MAGESKKKKTLNLKNNSNKEKPEGGGQRQVDP